MTQRILLLLVLLVPLLAVADKVDLKKDLVGKWNTADDATIHVEFTADNKVLFTATADDKEVPGATGTYKWVDATSIELTTTALGSTRTTHYKIAVAGASLTMTTDKGRVTKYKRA